MLALTDHQADPTRALVYHQLPNPVRISSLVAILPDPRAHLDIYSHEISVFTVPTRRSSRFEY